MSLKVENLLKRTEENTGCSKPSYRRQTNSLGTSEINMCRIVKTLKLSLVAISSLMVSVKTKRNIYEFDNETIVFRWLVCIRHLHLKVESTRWLLFHHTSRSTAIQMMKEERVFQTEKMSYLADIYSQRIPGRLPMYRVHTQ